jgi:hypothetical protein
MSEHRAAARHQTLRTGIVEFDNGTGSLVSVPCTIRDVSGTGARLQLNSSLWVAEQFTLVFSSGLRKDCRVAWRKGRLIGSAFAEGYASPDEQAVMMTADEQSRHRLGIGARVKAARETRGYTARVGGTPRGTARPTKMSKTTPCTVENTHDFRGLRDRILC